MRKKPPESVFTWWFLLVDDAVRQSIRLYGRRLLFAPELLGGHIGGVLRLRPDRVYLNLISWYTYQDKTKNEILLLK